jgi:diaminohydroxyphosphoribosylaminopyrimidine deaminase/5-amino-6-(5-phosphoribosylamino)uracil reductase
VRDDAAETLLLRTRDPHEALATLRQHDRQHVFLEGGATLAAAFIRADLVDEVVAYVAPAFLGAGTGTVADLGITTVSAAWRPVVEDVTVLEPVVAGEQPNVRITMRPQREDH